AGIWALGVVSLLMDVSSEMIHALLPLFMVGTLGMGVAEVGLLEGLAEATALVVKVFSGAISDWVGRRKPLAVLGYGLAAVTKPLFALATGPGLVVAARLLDRVGKGIRGAPRDALVADLTPEGQRGAAYGLRQTLDTIGAFVGPVIAIALMWATADNIPAVFWASLLPAGLSVTLLWFFVREPARPDRALPRMPISRAAMVRLGPGYWAVVAAASLFALAKFSEAFLVLRADTAGLRPAMIPLVLIVMNLVYAVAAYPAGAWSDRAGRGPVLAAGVGLLVAGDLVMAFGPGLAGAFGGIALWGASMGFTQGAFAALVADRAPMDLRGTAFGVLNLATGVATLAASVVAGLLWDKLGPSATFFAGAGLGLLALVAVLALSRGRRMPPGAG
ncbi:MAG: MFS transporter, partial [Maritimibacter sp.]|nr:MFS transporter [Maritimibacter sp.]